MEYFINLLKKHAMEHYEEGGHWMVECWDRKDWEKFVLNCDAYWRPYVECLDELMGLKQSYAFEIENA